MTDCSGFGRQIAARGTWHTGVEKLDPGSSVPNVSWSRQQTFSYSRLLSRWNSPWNYREDMRAYLRPARMSSRPPVSRSCHYAPGVWIRGTEVGKIRHEKTNWLRRNNLTHNAQR